jgi:hypothetical protein
MIPQQGDMRKSLNLNTCAIRLVLTFFLEKNTKGENIVNRGFFLDSLCAIFSLTLIFT